MTTNFFVAIDEVLEEWGHDAVIDKENLAGESIRVDQLIHKYQKYWFQASRVARGLAGDLKRLRLEKFEFYTKGASKERKPTGWRQAPQGLLTKTEASQYVDADPDVLALVDRLGAANDALTLIEEIRETLKKRTFHISNALNSEKFFAGVDR